MSDARRPYSMSFASVPRRWRAKASESTPDVLYLIYISVISLYDLYTIELLSRND